jgi:hypothetical protein
MKKIYNVLTFNELCQQLEIKPWQLEYFLRHEMVPQEMIVTREETGVKMFKPETVRHLRKQL